jgi:hypothetical protein
MTSAMRPGQIKPNDFELAILERLASKEPSLRGAVGQLHVLSREFTGVGSYTNFACEDSSADARDKQVGLDDLITMPGVPNGMGAVLFCKGDRPKCLEVFTYGNDHWEGVCDGFTIEQTA